MSGKLILILSTKLKVIYVERLLPSFVLGDVKFINILESDFIGFYDWLRTSVHQISGVRLTPSDFAEDAVRKTPSQVYTKFQSDGAIEIFFSNAFNFVEEISCDQDFGSVKVYISDNLEYAFGFDIENLTMIEQENLHLLLKENKVIDK
jgi:hypothetical protein